MFSNKKRLVTIVAALLVVVMAFTLTGCGAGGDPKGVVNAFFDSIDKQDAKKFLNCFQKDTRDMMLDGVDEDEIKDLLEMMDESLSDEYGDNWRKKVKVGKAEKGDTEDDITYYEVEVKMDEEEDTMSVIKVKGKFYIDESGLGGIM